MKRRFIVAASLVFSSKVFALDCPAAEIEHLQPQLGSILYKLKGYNWHRLGSPDDPGVRVMYSAMLAAQMSGKKVTVRYPDSYDCSAYELLTNALMVRTHN